MFKNQGGMIFLLIGFVGVGKPTIVRELCKGGYILVDNNPTNNPILSILKLEKEHKIPEKTWNAIDKIRNVVMC
jgi:hypothetical protein